MDLDFFEDEEDVVEECENIKLRKMINLFKDYLRTRLI